MPATTLRLLTHNIDWKHNLDRVEAFLKRSGADVACLQEVCEDDLGRLSSAFGADKTLFVAMTRGTQKGVTCGVGIAVLSRYPCEDASVHFYVGDAGALYDLDERTLQSRRDTTRRILMSCSIVKENARFQIATTHFTWTPNGKPDEWQLHDLERLFGILGGMGEFILCGDFNAPRGGGVFSALAQRYTDNVPPCITTTIDPQRHRVQGLSAMVDGIFTTPAYAVSRVEAHGGLSDHYALTGTASGH